MALKYRIQAFDMAGANFGPGNLYAEFTNAVNLGYAEYLSDVPEAFFTLSQDDPKISLLRANRYKTHIKIFRNSDLVWAGFLAEWEANERDAIIYAYGYTGLYHLVIDGWNIAYTNAQIDTIVNDAFTLAKTGLANTLTGWITKGTVQAPVTTSGGGTAIVLPSFRTFYKRPLQLFRDLSAVAIGDTTNIVSFEVTPAGLFNFWKNLGSDLSVTWRYGGKGIKGFYELQTPIQRRNDLKAVGINPNDVTLKDEVVDAPDIVTNGLRMEPLFFSWVRDSTELDRVLKLRASRAKSDNPELGVEFYANQMIPPRATGAAWAVGDRINVSINRGITQVSTPQLVWGSQVLYMRGSETVRALIQKRPGT